MKSLFNSHSIRRAISTSEPYLSDGGFLDWRRERAGNALFEAGLVLYTDLVKVLSFTGVPAVDAGTPS